MFIFNKRNIVPPVSHRHNTMYIQYWNLVSRNVISQRDIHFLLCSHTLCIHFHLRIRDCTHLAAFASQMALPRHHPTPSTPTNLRSSLSYPRPPSLLLVLSTSPIVLADIIVWLPLFYKYVVRRFLYSFILSLQETELISRLSFLYKHTK